MDVRALLVGRPRAAAHATTEHVLVRAGVVDRVVRGRVDARASHVLAPLGDVPGHVEIAPYGQILQSLVDPASLLNAKRRGLNVLLLRVSDLLRELPESRATSPAFLEQYLGDTVRDLERAVRAHRTNAPTDTLVVLCPWPTTGTATVDQLLTEAESEKASPIARIFIAG